MTEENTFLTQAELERVEELHASGKTEEAQAECDKFAIGHGLRALPEGIHYGLTDKGRLLPPVRPTPISNDEAFALAMRSPVMDWILGRR